MKKDFIPVEAKVNGQDAIWYMDTSKLSLSDLINLRNELKGNKVDSVIVLDAIIYDSIDCNNQELKSTKREIKKDNYIYKSHKAMIRKRRNGRR